MVKVRSRVWLRLMLRARICLESGLGLLSAVKPGPSTFEPQKSA